MSTTPSQQNIIDSLGQDLLDAVYEYEKHSAQVSDLTDTLDSFTDPIEAIKEIGISRILDTTFDKLRLQQERARALDAYVVARAVSEAPSDQTAENVSV